jgi:hypothetical protein
MLHWQANPDQRARAWRTRALVSVLAVAAAQQAGATAISVDSATYGSECGARSGNLTRDAAAQCNRHDTCAYAVHREAAITRNANGPACRGSFSIAWSCGTAHAHVAHLAAESGDSTVVISCLLPAGAGH